MRWKGVVLSSRWCCRNDTTRSSRTRRTSLRGFSRRMESIDGCDAVVAIVDGPDADSGTCVEIGYAKGRGKTVIGVRTDFRGSEDHGLNLMITNICTHLVTAPSTATTLDQLADRIIKVLIDGTAPLVRPASPPVP